MCGCNCTTRLTELEQKVATFNDLEKVQFVVKGNDLVRVLRKHDREQGR